MIEKQINILAFSIGAHDSNACFWDGKMFRYMKSERMFGRKHHHFSHPFEGLDFIKNWAKSYNFKPDLVVFTDGNRQPLISKGERQNSNDLYKEVAYVKENDKFWSVKTICVDHSYAHILSAWPIVDSEKLDIGVACDGTSDHDRSIAIIKNPSKVKDASFYKTWGDGRSIGKWFKWVGQYMGMKVVHRNDYAGKIMGLQSYGKIDNDFIKSIYPIMKTKLKGSSKHIKIDNLWANLFDIEFRGIIPSNNMEFYKAENQDFRDWIATTHKLMEMWIADLFNEYVNKTDTIAYSGGVAQNVLFNEVLYSNYKNIFIPPHSYDGGLSIGCIEVGRLLCDLPKIKVNDMTFPYWQDDVEHMRLDIKNLEDKLEIPYNTDESIIETPNDDTINRVAELLSEGKIVGWFQGRGEIGPRALGNRSILMHPGLPNGKDILNERVKHREYWRPFAPSLLEEHLEEWFDTDKGNKFMLRAVKTKKNKEKQIQSIVHNDGTARIQTVNKNDNPSYYQLIKKFYEKTNIPVVVNTSLNDGGLPIFAYKQQCIEFFNNADIDALCMGNELIIKK